MLTCLAGIFSLTRYRNKGELAEGWYDPAIKHKADTAALEEDSVGNAKASKSQERKSPPPKFESSHHHLESESEDEFGPLLPTNALSTPNSKSSISKSTGPTIPSLQDLALRDELVSENSRSTYLSEQAYR